MKEEAAGGMLTELDRIEARLDARRVELERWVSGLRQELAALPAAPSGVPACFVESEGRLADALAGLAASVEELRIVLREHR